MINMMTSWHQVGGQTYDNHDNGHNVHQPQVGGQTNDVHDDNQLMIMIIMLIYQPPGGWTSKSGVSSSRKPYSLLRVTRTGDHCIVVTRTGDNQYSF